MKTSTTVTLILAAVLTAGALTGALALPPAPSGLTATPGNQQATLTWAVAVGASTYSVKRAAVAAGPFTTIASTIATNYTDTGLTNGTTYYYVVSAVNASGEGANSAQVSAKPAALPLGISPVGAANVALGSAYSQLLDGSGGVMPYGWSVVSGALPPGLAIITGPASNECTISGIPTLLGSFSFTIQLSDHTGATVTRAYSMVVAPAIPSICNGCVLNSASFSKDASGQGTPVAPGSLVAIFTSPLAASAAAFNTPSLPDSLGGVSVAFNGIQAPIVSVTPGGTSPFVGAQVPFEVLLNGAVSGMVPIWLIVNGVASTAVQTPIAPSAPGIFTIPATGKGNAILVFVDPVDKVVKIAAPLTAAATVGYPTAAIPRGATGFFYATGLGAMTPSVANGTGVCTAANGICQANATPIVLIGGITVPVSFAGQAPGFPGVYQINITIPQSVPAGASLQLVMKSPDGSVTSNSATIAVR